MWINDWCVDCHGYQPHSVTVYTLGLMMKCAICKHASRFPKMKIN